MLLAAIPAPPGNRLDIGPLSFRYYGLAIALGVLVAVTIARRRWVARGGNPDDIASIATWAVPAGLIGARAYHVLTDHHRFDGRWLHVFYVWEGGLGIPGGILAGVLTGIWVAHRRGLPVLDLLDVVAPAMPVAQAIGRLGNWFNQELFGRPTSLPWGLHVDPEFRPTGYEHVSTFHPTFLYEGLWNLALVGLILLLERRGKLRRAQAFFLYIGGYGLGRLWVESLRIDVATHVFGVRVNIWVALLILAIGVIGLVRTRRGPAALRPGESAAQPDVEHADVEPVDVDDAGIDVEG